MPDHYKNILPDSSSAEMILVFLCAGSLSTDSYNSEISSLISRVNDWNQVIELAEHHRLLPLLHRQLQNSRIVPPAVISQLHNKQLANTVRNTFLSQELCKILDLLQANKLSPIPIKGPTLAVTAYNDISLRQFDDLDIILPTENITQAAILMKDLGFKPRLEMSASERLAHIKAGWGCSLCNEDNSLFIEFDNGVAAHHFAFDIPFKKTKKRMIEIHLNNQKIQTVSPEDTLILLSVHGTKHLWERLSWISDISHLITNNKNIDWNYTLHTATNLGSRRMLLLGLQYSALISNIIFPIEITNAINKEPMIARLVKSSIDSTANEIKITNSTTRIIYHLKSRERIKDKIKYLMLLLFTPSIGDWNTVRLPRYLFGFYYIIRPFRLLGKLVTGTGPS